MSDGYFAQVETSFILNDPRLNELTPAQRWIYMVIWCYAVETHKDITTLPHNCHNFVTFMSHLCRVDARTVSLALTNLCSLNLIEMPNKTTLIVCGVKGKHPKLKWKNCGKPKVDLPLIPPQGDRVEESRVEKRRGQQKKPKADEPKQPNWVDEVWLAYADINESYKYVEPYAATQNFINWYRQHSSGISNLTKNKLWKDKLKEWLDKDEKQERDKKITGG